MPDTRLKEYIHSWYVLGVEDMLNKQVHFEKRWKSDGCKELKNEIG